MPAGRAAAAGCRAAAEMLCAQSDVVPESATRVRHLGPACGPPPAWKRTKEPLPSKSWLSPASWTVAVEELAVVGLAGGEVVARAGVVEAPCCPRGIRLCDDAAAEQAGLRGTGPARRCVVWPSGGRRRGEQLGVAAELVLRAGASRPGSATAMPALNRRRQLADPRLELDRERSERGQRTGRGGAAMGCACSSVGASSRIVAERLVDSEASAPAVVLKFVIRP